MGTRYGKSMECIQCIYNVLIVYSFQLHGNVEEDLEQLRLEEASLKRRQKLQDGQTALDVSNGGRLSVDSGSGQPSLSQLQRKRKELG